uniref:CCHC-type domain-containing protein n=1 Tax=Tanacetum cinerariifolium TaxID=118510 RepID=A0A6L2JNS3_TANCI|nr:hypothetical protein [Tanacetum cinerariifolium]
MLAPTFGQNRARITPIQDLGVIYDRRYRYAVMEWYDLVNSNRFSIYEFDAMLEDLGIKGGSFLFSHFRIHGKSLDEGLVPLISHQDVLSLLKYVSSYKENNVYLEKHTMVVVSGKRKGVVIEEIMEDYEVNEASETGYRGQSLLLNENDVQIGNMESTSKVDHPPWSSGSLSDSDISEHPPRSSESMNEKRNKRQSKDSEFGDSYEAPAVNPTTGSASDGTGKKKGRRVTLTTDDMQKRKNDVKARTTLLLSLLDEHQLRFSKYKTAQELWAAILKTFGGNEATKKTKKNLLKSDLDTMSLDDLYNHLKVYESEVQKKLEPNSQNMAFISLAKHSSGNEEINIASVSTASTNVSTASVNIRVASISQDTACAYIASQSSGKKISIQGTDVAGFDKSKVECFNCHKMGHFPRQCRAPRSQDRGRRDNYRQGSKVEEHAPKALMEIDGVGWDWSYMANDEENHALIADE